MYIYRLPYENELCHHGIKGQKWGVRRYQNPDKTLTEAGRKRYSELEAKKKEEKIKLNKMNKYGDPAALKNRQQKWKVDRLDYKQDKLLGLDNGKPSSVSPVVSEIGKMAAKSILSVIRAITPSHGGTAAATAVLSEVGNTIIDHSK